MVFKIESKLYHDKDDSLNLLLKRGGIDFLLGLLPISNEINLHKTDQHEHYFRK